MDNAFWFCKEKVAWVGSENYYAMLSLRPWQKQATTVLLAFTHEIHHISLDARESSVRYQQLQFWFDECQRAFLGQPQHPVMLAIKQVFADSELPYDAFLQILFATQQRITSSLILAEDAATHFQQFFNVIPLLTRYVYAPDKHHCNDFATSLSIYLARVHVLRNLSAYTRNNLYYFSSLHTSGATQLSVEIPDFVDELNQFIITTQNMLTDILQLVSGDVRFSQRFLITQAKLQQRALDKFYKNIQNGKIIFPECTPIANFWYARKFLREEIKNAIR